MSTNIDLSVLKNFIVSKIDGERLTEYKARELEINGHEFRKGDSDQNEYLELDEMMNCTDIYAKFVALYEEEENGDKANAKDNEEEQLKVPEGQGGAKA